MEENMETAVKKRKKENVFEFMLGIILFTLIFAAAAFLIGVTLNRYINELSQKRAAETASAVTSLPVVIIDPGHGGEDGGCSEGDAVEKDLNLALSRNIYDLCEIMGLPAKMTRTEDTLLYDMYGDLTDYKGKKKTYDLRNRVRFTNEENGGIYLGIHMNKFPQSEYKGLQVYYSPNNSESKAVADRIQTYTKAYLQPDNNRQTKKSGDSIFILSKLTVPSVLVECGFLSNPEDVSNLSDAEYRKALSMNIFSAVAECAYLEK